MLVEVKEIVMLNALKKLVSHDAPAGSKGHPPAGMQTMGQSLQRRFAKGVQYNMKIIIKGDRNVGKSCLFYRLQGQKFKEEYLPTEEIQVASIQWNYKATDDIVKVEVWDVVDKGKKRKKIEGLKLENTVQENTDEPALDAEFINVYKGTHGVIMMLDITKQWTYDYIQRELPRIPPHLPVLVLANHRDMGHHRTVTEDQVRYYIESLDRPPGSAQIRYAESSMRNGFGLKFLHKFFNLPFLQLQRETLQRQLETNSQETDATNDELDVLQESDEQNYDFFLESLTTRRRQVAEQLTNIPSPEDSGITSPSSQMNGITPSASMSNFSSNLPAPSRSVPSTPSQPLPRMEMTRSPTVLPTTISHSQEASKKALPAGDSSSKPSSFMSRLFNRSSNQTCSTNVTDEQNPALVIAQNSEGVKNVEEFVPEGLDQSFNLFLDDAIEAKSDIDGPSVLESDSDDEVSGNPMVAGFQDEIDPEDSTLHVAVNSHFVEENDSQVDIAVLPEQISDGEDSVVEAASEVAIHSINVVDAKELPQEAESPPLPALYSLENEDLSFLERKYISSSHNAPSNAPSRSSNSATTPEGSEVVSEDSTTTRVKKHKQKDKRKDEEKSRRKSHKHRKHREKDGEKVSGGRKTRSQEKENSSDMQKLEEFLGGDTKDAYESL